MPLPLVAAVTTTPPAPSSGYSNMWGDAYSNLANRQ